MNRLARIVGGIVVGFRVATEFTPPEGETWVAVPDHVQIGASLVNGEWLKPDGQAYSADERRYRISPLALLDRLSVSELKVVISLALGSTPQSITNQQEGAWRLMLSLGATGHLLSDGRASLVLPSLFGATRAAELLAPDPEFQPS
jgi:hypothetical protein